MLNEKECTRILNEGEFKFTHEQMLKIRDFISKLALIEYENYKNKPNTYSIDERNLLQEGQYRRAS